MHSFHSPHSGTVLCQSTPRPAKIPLAVFLPRPHFASHTPSPPHRLSSSVPPSSILSFQRRFRCVAFPIAFGPHTALWFQRIPQSWWLSLLQEICSTARGHEHVAASDKAPTLALLYGTNDRCTPFPTPNIFLVWISVSTCICVGTYWKRPNLWVLEAIFFVKQNRDWRNLKKLKRFHARAHNFLYNLRGSFKVLIILI